METILGMKPNEFTFAAMVFLIGGFASYFITRQFWPWFTKVRWPAHQEQIKLKTDREFEIRQAKEQAELNMEIERQRQQYEIQIKSLEIQQNIRDALIELKTLVSQNATSLQRVEIAVSNGMEIRLRSIEEALLTKKEVA